MGTSSYMCLEYANGTVRLESTIYEVWMSSKWYIEGDENTSTIDNMWKSTRNNGTGGFLYTKDKDSTTYYGTTAQSWIVEDYSSSTNVDDDGVQVN